MGYYTCCIYLLFVNFIYNFFFINKPNYNDNFFFNSSAEIAD